MRARARALFPASGRAYGLFDSAVFLLVLSFYGFVRQTSMSGHAALAHISTYIPIPDFGLLITAGAVVSILCSYRSRWVDLGYQVAIFTTAIVAAIYFSSLFLIGWDDRVLVSTVVYGYVARRLMTEDDRTDPCHEHPHCLTRSTDHEPACEGESPPRIAQP